MSTLAPGDPRTSFLTKIQLSLEATVRRVLTADSRGLTARCFGAGIVSSPKCTQAEACAWDDQFYDQSRRTAALAVQQIGRDNDPTMSPVMLYPVETGLAEGADVTYARVGSLSRVRLPLHLTLRTHGALYARATMESPTHNMNIGWRSLKSRLRVRACLCGSATPQRHTHRTILASLTDQGFVGFSLPRHA